MTSQPSGRIYANAQGTNSIIDFSKLPELFSDSQYDSGLEAGSGGAILTGALATLNRGDLQLDDNQSSITTSHITSITSSNLYVYGGGDLAFPALSQFSQPNGATLLANGAGSVLDLSSLTSLVGASSYSTLSIDAQAGGKVNLSNVTGQPSGRIYANAQGTNSIIDFSKLPELFSDSQYDSELEAGSGGAILTGALATLNRGDLQLDDNQSSITTSHITSITSSNLYVYGGGDLAFPALSQFSQPNGATLLANGAGSVLDLSSLTSLVGASSYSTLSIDAQAGGKVNLSNVTSQPSGRIYANAQGTNSIIDFSKLPELFSDSQYDSGLEAGTGGAILTGALTTLNRGDLQLDDNQSSIITSHITSITSSNLSVYAGGDLAFPALSQFSQPNGATLLATGAGSVLDLTSLTSLVGATGYADLNFDAQAGGTIDLSSLSSYGGGSARITADGSNSVVKLTSLPNFSSDAQYNSTLTASNGGQIVLTPGTIALTRVDVDVTSAGKVVGGTLRLLPSSSLSGGATVQANVISAGTINPGDSGSGVLTIDGSFAQYGDGTLNVQVGASTSGGPYDQLAVTGAVQFGGTFSVSSANGFTPQVGNQFSVITYASRSGEFSTYDGLSYATGKTFQTDYNATNFTLVAATADIRVFPTTGLLTSEAGDFTSFTVLLATQPASNVTLNLSSSNTSAGTISPSTLTFTTADWNVPQTVTVTGLNGNQSGSTPYQVVFAPAVSADTNYSGIVPTSVSLTNLPDEVERIAVANLAVTPSTGLSQGSSLTVTWNDSNTGNLPAAAAWDDQVVITNTTTGHTLVTALVSVDPGVDGVLNPGASLEQQYAFTLPTDADAIGNLQISVTANVNHSAFESAASLTNANLLTYSNANAFPSAPTTINVGGVDFALIPDETTSPSLGALQTASSGTSFDIPVNISGGTALNTLINSTYGVAGDTVGTVEVKGTGGADATFNLVEGTNIRDYNNGPYNNTIAPGTPSASFGSGQIRLDMQTFSLPAAFATARITDIIFTSSGGTPQGNPFLAAATVTTATGPSQLVLLGSGVAPDVANSSTTTVVSGSTLPGQAGIVLDPASDSGVQGDDLTNDTTPTFDVTVNEAGVIQVDYKGDRSSTASLSVTAAGQYSFTSPALADGSYTAKVTFTPGGGSAVTASVGYTIDTKAPTLVPGSSTAQGPLYSRTLTFSKNINAATIGAASIAISGPGITGSIQPASIIGSGTTYVVTFATPLTKGGNYTLALAAAITDLAGNSIGSGVTDHFQLTPDTSLPTVTAVTPSGLTNADVSSLSVNFDKAINASTFTSALVSISGPAGAIATGSITITEVDAADYTVAFPTQSQEGTYDISIGGPGVLDISGNAMAAAYQTSFTIDHSVLSVVSVSPTGAVSNFVDHIDVTFDKVMNASTLNGSNITLIGPGGAVAVGQGTLVSGDTFSVPIAPQRANGSYQLTIGTGAEAQSGAFLGTAYQASFTVSLPDLLVSSVSPSGGSAKFGGTLNVGWTVTNNGTAGATGPWMDNVYLSTTPALAAGAIYLGSFTAENSGVLAAGASYNGQATVQIPFDSLLAAGTYYLVVLTDAGGVVNESDLTTQQSSVSINLSAPAPPDLSVSSVTSSLSSAQPGQTETVTWKVQNVGASPATGSWTDSVYLSPDGKLSDATLFGSVNESGGLAGSASYPGTLTETLSSSLADGSYQVIVVTDSGDAVATDPNRANNQSSAPAPLAFGHVDLVPSITTAPTAATSGTSITVRWSTTNTGTAPTLRGWIDDAYLSTTSQVTSSSLLLGTVSQSGPMGPGQSAAGSASATIPLGDSGTYQIIIVADATNQLIEPGGVANSTSQAVNITLAPYADLAVTSVTAPSQTIGDPAYPVISWTVKNVGTGTGQTSTWTDAIIASPSNNYNDPDAVVLAEYPHTTSLAPGQSYSQMQTVQMPPGFTGRYHLFVETDAGNAVFENGSKANNVGEAPNNFDVMPIPYADLVVSSIVDPQNAGSGLPVNVTWTVTNQGIGLTSVPSWQDDLALASDPAGKNILEDYGLFDHLGPVGPGGNYVRTAQVVLPQGLSGTYYFVVTAAASTPPFEFIYGNGTDNISVSAPFTISFTPPPDLTVTSVSAPTTGEEGSTIQVGWTVQNVGSGPALGSWQDEVVIQPTGQPNAQFLVLGTFTNFSGLGAGNSYSRTEAVNLPLHISGLYNVEVIANFDGELFTNGATNNTGVAPQPITVTVTPRPNLEVDAIEAPSSINAGGSFSVTYTVINQGTAPTTNNWDDKIYLSLTPYVADDSILIEDLPNQAALDPGDEYQATTVPVTVPDRYAGQVYVIVDVDAKKVVDQWPNGLNNVQYQPIQVNPLPFPDLVLSNVVVPTQEIAGSTFNVNYTVTNLGSGPTLSANWTDAIWLTRDKTRPIPASGDILLSEGAHSGGLVVGAGYDATQTVTLPINLAPGTYYITPWTDMYSVLLQTELSVNVNPDDPNNFQNDNYKAAQIVDTGAVAGS